MESWYAIHTKTGQEKVATEHLERQGYHIYLPLLSNSRRRRGKWRAVVEPLFPGYLFAQLDTNIKNISPIRSTRGVIGPVRFGGELCRVPVEVINELVCSQPDRFRLIDPARVFKPGDHVKIVEGPLAGVSAIFQAKSAEERVYLLLDLLGRTNQVVVSTHQVVPAA